MVPALSQVKQLWYKGYLDNKSPEFLFLQAVVDFFRFYHLEGEPCINMSYHDRHSPTAKPQKMFMNEKVWDQVEKTLQHLKEYHFDAIAEFKRKQHYMFPNHLHVARLLGFPKPFKFPKRGLLSGAK